MVFTNLSNVCSHLQNASRARLSLTSIPMTKMHLALCLSMQKQGLFSTVQVGSREPPVPEMEQDIKPEAREALESELEEKPWLGLSYSEIQDDGTTLAKKFTKPIPNSRKIHIPGVPDNPAKRRIWLGLKYWNNEPVLKNMSMISKPTRKINAKLPELRKLVSGRKAGLTNPMVNPGECMFVSTDIGVMEAREALERMRGGCLLLRTS
jgi:ribosomal protein S8